MNPQKGGGRSRDEDAKLVDSVVGRVKSSKMLKGRLPEVKQKGRCDSLVDCIFRNVNEQQGKHTTNGLATSVASKPADTLTRGRRAVWFALGVT